MELLEKNLSVIQKYRKPQEVKFVEETIEKIKAKMEQMNEWT